MNRKSIQQVYYYYYYYCYSIYINYLIKNLYYYWSCHRYIMNDDEMDRMENDRLKKLR